MKSSMKKSPIVGKFASLWFQTSTNSNKFRLLIRSAQLEEARMSIMLLIRSPTDCWKLSIQRKGNDNLELLRLFAFSVNIIHLFGQQKAWAISVILLLFSNQKYPKIELCQNLILKTYAIRTSPKPFRMKTRNAEAVRF